MVELASAAIDNSQCNVVVEPLSKNSESTRSWDSFVQAHPHGSPFHLAAWQRVIEESFGHRPVHLVARNAPDGQIDGILPLFLVHSRIFGRMLISTPQATYAGVLANSRSAWHALLSHARSLAREYRVRFLEIRSFPDPIADSSFLTKDLYVTFRQQLQESTEANLAAIPRKTRAEIREGIRNGLEFRADEIGVDEFYGIYSRSVRELGTPVFSKRLFTIGLSEFGSNCRIFSVHWKGKTVAAVWTLFYLDQVIPHYGGSFREYNHLAVNNFMYWMLIKFGCENGYKTYDFGRSKKGTGSFDFKKRWGMQMIDLPYQYFLVRGNSLPDTSPLNPRFSLGIRLWRKMPLWLANSVGPLIARHLT